MPQPLNAQTNHDGLRYYTFNEHRLLSVTSARRVVGMPFLLHEWSVSQVISAAKAMRGEEALGDDEWGKAIRRASTSERDSAANLGTSVHEAADQGLKAQGMSSIDPRQPFLLQYEAFQQKMKPEVLVSEAQVFHLGEGYAGSLDQITLIDGEVTVIDIKTGKGTYIDHALQLALYFWGEFIGGYDPILDRDIAFEDATEHLQSATRAAVLHLRPEGWELIDIPMTPQLTDAALSMVRLARFFEQHPTIQSLPLMGTGVGVRDVPGPVLGNLTIGPGPLQTAKGATS
jgi:hypothetical protein